MRSPTVMVVAFDAAERSVVLDLATAGSMPNVRDLVDRGLCAVVENPSGFFVSAVWPSIFTGASPARHGRFSGVQLHPASYELEHFEPSQLEVEPFWAALSREDRRCAIVDVPHTVPLPGLNGIQLCGWGNHDGPHVFRTSPPGLAAEIIDRFGRYPANTCDSYARRDALPEMQRDLLAAISRKADLAEFLLDEEDWDLFMVTFSESHCVGHDCWHLHDADHPQHDRSLTEEIGDPVLNIYQALDAALGRLLAKVDDETTVLLLLSHGIGPDYEANSALDGILWRLEEAYGGAPPSFDTRLFLSRARRSVQWRARRRLGLPQGAGRGAVDRRRRFFKLPNNDACGAIRINLAGREPDGRVRPGPEYEDTVGMLEREFQLLINLETGEPLVRGVFRTADRYDGPAVPRMPDLYVEWNRDAPIRAIGSPAIGRIAGARPSFRTGDHRPSGLLVGAGPSIDAGRVGTIESVQIAPTICGLLECELPESEAPPLSGARGAPT